MLVLLLALTFICILELLIYKIFYLNGMGNNLITSILHSSMKRCLPGFVINSFKLLYIVLHILSTFKVQDATYISFYVSNADRAEAITGRNCSSALIIYVEIDTHRTIWVCLLKYYISWLPIQNFMNIVNALEILFPDVFFPPSEWLPCEFTHLFHIHATIFQNVFWKLIE